MQEEERKTEELKLNLKRIKEEEQKQIELNKSTKPELLSLKHNLDSLKKQLNEQKEEEEKLKKCFCELFQAVKT